MVQISQPSLSNISIYPVKSLGRIQLDQAEVTVLGLKNDRTMMLVDEKKMFITQRKYPQLALIQTQQSNDALLINAPNMPALKVKPSDFETTPTQITIWKDLCHGYLANQSINQWFSQYLGFPVQLVNYAHKHPRKTDPIYSQENDYVSFADGFPLLVISQASLDDLNSRLEQPISMARFRPNLVIENCTAYAEDSWKSLKIGNVTFEAVKTCSRCILTTVDPETGIKSDNGEPLKTLSQYRRTDNGIIFGMNLIPRTTGSIKLGDPVYF
ncbi:MOSC domain-containing protein [Aliikangiella sp. IMCC44359]|uniref:MOSC domain-containing protein n=1 Tax=Aliikangiella sp. IMCC44359 TaxID=3459125 RepID=UPI00403AD981